MIKKVAGNLVGKELKNGWKVVKQIKPEKHATGGMFSIPYLVENNRERAFLKALDFKAFFEFKKISGLDIEIADAIKDFVDTFVFERDLTRKCRKEGLGNIIRLIDEGQYEFDGGVYGVVPYLIFEMADGDVRSILNFTSEIESAWKLKSLHGVAKGLQQLHNINVSHQDLKPSNVLICEGNLSKIGDLGRSLAKGMPAPHSGQPFTGDYKYAPPEILYGHLISDWEQRVFAIDMYLLGGLLCYYFSGLPINALIRENLNDTFYWRKWSGTFEGVKPYLLDAFEVSINQFTEEIFIEGLKPELKTVLRQLCYPYPEKRGHPANLASRASSYSLIRYISIFDRLYKSVKYKIIR